MRKIKKLFLWYLLLNKRFLKKPGLWAILIAIPLLVVALNIVSMQQSGVIRVGIAAENNSDPLTAEIIKDLTKENRLIHFILYKTPSEAEEMMNMGKVDETWIFSDNMEKGLDEFLSSGKSVVKILEREETIPLMLARQKLSGIIFKKCAPSFYINYVRRTFPELDKVPDEKLIHYYDEVKVQGEELFEFSYANSSQSTNDATKAGYLMTPVRGLIALMLFLSGLAAAMFYTDDDKSGTFAWIGDRVKPLVAGVFHLIPISLTALSMLISLYFSGLWVGFLREFLILVFYVISLTAFSMLIRLILKSNKVIGAATPIIMLLFVFICPVFVDIQLLRPIQNFIPTYHYLAAVHNDKYVIIMLLYAVICAMVYFLLSKIWRKA